MVHDRLNDRTFAWWPDQAAAYAKYAREVEPGVISFDGLLRDGWQPAGAPDPAA
jgi:hypothetical protein